jgi:hypothetical protein
VASVWVAIGNETTSRTTTTTTRPTTTTYNYLQPINDNPNLTAAPIPLIVTTPSILEDAMNIAQKVKSSVENVQAFLTPVLDIASIAFPAYVN